MVPYPFNKWVVVLVSLFAVTSSMAAPTVNSDIKACVTVAAPAPEHAEPLCASDPGLFVTAVDGELARLGAGVFAAPSRLADYTASRPALTRTLPPAPQAILMASLGFVCVSLVRDRRIWLSFAVAPLWLGQAGFVTLPELVSSLRSPAQVQKKCLLNTARAYEMDCSCRRHSDTEGTSYMGLLRHLAVIDGDATAPQTALSLKFLEPGPPAAMLPRSHRTRSGIQNGSFRNEATETVSRTDAASVCTARISTQHIYFSPAFTCDRLGRGPPRSAQ